jgi:hypothetical protein
MSYFHHSLLRNLTISFGSIFNNLYIRKTEDDGAIIDEYRVPLSYANKDRFISKIRGENDGVRIQSFIPRIGFTMESLAYAPDRQLSAHNKITGNVKQVDNAWIKNTSYTPAPYDVDYNVSIYTNNTDDSLQLIEQIAPMFRPDFNISVNEMPDLDIIRDIPVTLNNISMDDTWASNFDQGELRTVVWDLNFTIRANLYAPINKLGVIDSTFISFVPLSGSDPIEDDDIWFTPDIPQIYIHGGVSVVAVAQEIGVVGSATATAYCL